MRAITKYVSFSAENFCRDYIPNRIAVKHLREELAELDGVRGIDPSREKVQSSPSSDGMDKTIAARMRIEDKIAEYDSYFEVYQSAMKMLEPEEKYILHQFFNNARTPEETIDKLESEGVNRRRSYRIRARALDKISKFLIG